MAFGHVQKLLNQKMVSKDGVRKWIENERNLNMKLQPILV